jgi:hypothetical protein
MAQTRSLDYPKLTKQSFLLGITLLVVGAVGEFVGHTYFAPMPAWEATLFLDMEALGVVIALLSPFVFGIALPLIE